MNFLDIIKENFKGEEKDIVLLRRDEPLSLSHFILNGSGIIGEFKRSTPKKKFKLKFLPEEIALSYEKHGCSAVSVVVENKFFLTSEQDFQRIKNVVSIPVIHKAFIFNEFQIVKARNNGADSILLIASLLDKRKLENLIIKSEELKMEAIVEVHSVEDVEKISDLPVKIVGINNRDLSTLKVNLDHGERILNMVVKKNIGNIRIIESGLKNAKDVKRFKESGAQGFLIGSAFLESLELEEKIKEMVGAMKK